MLNKGRQDGARLLSSTTGNEAASSVIAQNYGGLEKIHPLLLLLGACQVIHLHHLPLTLQIRISRLLHERLTKYLLPPRTHLKKEQPP